MKYDHRILVAIEPKPFAEGLSDYLRVKMPHLDVVKWCDSTHGDMRNPDRVLGALKSTHADVLVYRSRDPDSGTDSRLSGFLLPQLPELRILWLRNDCMQRQHLDIVTYDLTLDDLLRALGQDSCRVIPWIERN